MYNSFTPLSHYLNIPKFRTKLVSLLTIQLVHHYQDRFYKQAALCRVSGTPTAYKVCKVKIHGRAGLDVPF